MTTPDTAPPDPPEHLPADVAAVWIEIVEANQILGRIDRGALEAFCTLVARLRQVREEIDERGTVVEDARGRLVANPGLATEQALANQIRAWGDRFAPLVKARRGARGYMADATAVAISAAPHLAQPKYAGAVAAVKTLAWLIDEAQRAGMDALMKVAYTLIPTYLKACADLQITPASVPVVPVAPPVAGGEGASTGGVLGGLRGIAGGKA